jgi:hypothetical protein
MTNRAYSALPRLAERLNGVLLWRNIFYAQALRSVIKNKALINTYDTF